MGLFSRNKSPKKNTTKIGVRRSSDASSLRQDSDDRRTAVRSSALNGPLPLSALDVQQSSVVHAGSNTPVRQSPLATNVTEADAKSDSLGRKLPRFLKGPAAKSKRSNANVKESEDATFALRSFRLASDGLETDAKSEPLQPPAQITSSPRPSLSNRSSITSETFHTPSGGTISISQFREAAQSSASLRSLGSSSSLAGPNMPAGYAASGRQSPRLDLPLPPMPSRIAPTRPLPTSRRSSSQDPTLDYFALPKQPVRSHTQASDAPQPTSRRNSRGLLLHGDVSAFFDEPESLQQSSLSPPQPAFARPKSTSRPSSAGSNFFTNAATSLSMSFANLVALPDSLPGTPIASRAGSFRDAIMRSPIMNGQTWYEPSGEDRYSYDVHSDDHEEAESDEEEPIQMQARTQATANTRTAYNSVDAEQRRQLARAQVAQFAQSSPSLWQPTYSSTFPPSTPHSSANPESQNLRTSDEISSQSSNPMPKETESTMPPSDSLFTLFNAYQTDETDQDLGTINHFEDISLDVDDTMRHTHTIH